MLPSIGEEWLISDAMYFDHLFNNHVITIANSINQIIRIRMTIRIIPSIKDTGFHRCNNGKPLHDEEKYHHLESSIPEGNRH